MDSFEKKAKKFLDSPQGAALSGKEDRIRAIADSRDGQKVKGMVDEAALSSAIERGDADVIRAELSKIASSTEGARLLQQLSELMK